MTTVIAMRHPPHVRPLPPPVGSRGARPSGRCVTGRKGEGDVRGSYMPAAALLIAAAKVETSV